MLDHILQMEHQVWAAVCSRDGESLRELFSDDYLEVTLEGVRTDKETIAEQSPQVDEIREYEIADAKIVELAPESVLLSYKLTLDGECRGETIKPPQRWATSIWRKDEGVWRCCFYQQSACSDA